MDDTTIRGERLTNWAASPDGRAVRLGFEDASGRACAISLPIDALSALMMTIPRMLRQALNTTLSDGSLRMIHELGEWRIERAVAADVAILSLCTPDGFEVAFTVVAAQADRLGEMLRGVAALPAEPRPAIN